MARQMGFIKLSGTVGGICFYRLATDYYARKKSSLTGRRVKTDKAFEPTMRSAALLARAAIISSAVYQRLPREQRSRKLYQQLTGQVMRLLKKGVDESEVHVKLKPFRPPGQQDQT